MGIKVIDALCNECHHKEEMIIDISDWDAEWTCPSCDTGIMRRTISAPMVLNASFVDGTKRQGFDDMKEINKLRRAAADLPHSERGGIKGEIRKLGGRTDGI